MDTLVNRNELLQELTTKDIKMSKGYAIISMLALHLFCLKDSEVIGHHFIWLSPDTPLLYYVGWLCAICAPTYCICSGYAHYKLGGQWTDKSKKN